MSIRGASQASRLDFGLKIILALPMLIIGMAEIDPSVTEDFLRSQPGVLEAYAWLEGGRLVAQVTVSEGEFLSPRALQVACKVELGQRHTPGAINLIQSRLKAA